MLSDVYEAIGSDGDPTRWRRGGRPNRRCYPLGTSRPTFRKVLAAVSDLAGRCAGQGSSSSLPFLDIPSLGEQREVGVQDALVDADSWRRVEAARC